MKMRYAPPITLAVLHAGVFAQAQEPVRPATDAESLFKDRNKKISDEAAGLPH